MNALGKRQKLAPESYRRLQAEILERDGWRCQSCGSMAQLQVHHIECRSHSGDDAEVNLITLCVTCHRKCHTGQKSQ
jgi:5-methylcytosine-specific restriction endonuclease McrA